MIEDFEVRAEEEPAYRQAKEKANSTAQLLRDVLEQVGIPSSDRDKIHGAVTLSAKSYVTLGTITESSATKIVDMLIRWKLDRQKEQQRRGEPIG
ncbi:hypothetical protein [Streptomyces sp. NBC_01465]|uniref:hypothetical protein n=1 Tax=Streptomyces sp. NBC_01465 TaxID=2903878 RepID=UPI002E31A7CA|nr:hypothetical protein [Streptomyces sp. NBC_01465]